MTRSILMNRLNRNARCSRLIPMIRWSPMILRKPNSYRSCSRLSQTIPMILKNLMNRRKSKHRSIRKNQTIRMIRWNLKKHDVATNDARRAHCYQSFRCCLNCRRSRCFRCCHCFRYFHCFQKSPIVVGPLHCPLSERQQLTKPATLSSPSNRNST